MAWSPRIQDTPVLERMVSDVTVTDPKHSLFGQRFTVLPERSGRGPGFVVVALADGRRRSIRIAATDLARASAEAERSPAEAPRVSVRTLTPLARHLRATLSLLAEEVICDDSSRSSASRSVSVAVESVSCVQPAFQCLPPAMAKPVGGGASAVRTGAGPTPAPSSANGRRLKGGGRPC